MPLKAKPALAKKKAEKGTESKRTAKEGGAQLSDSDLKGLVPKGIAESFVKSKLHDKDLAVAGLGEPLDWEGGMPELPNDIAGLDHDALSDLHAQFTNAHSTSIWAASKHYVEADAYEEIADYLRNIALLDSKESNDTKRKADAETSAGYLAAKTMERQHYRSYVRHRDLANTLDKRAKAVSRIGGFIGDEADNEDARTNKPSTRGKSAGSGRGSSKGGSKIRSRR